MFNENLLKVHIYNIHYMGPTFFQIQKSKMLSNDYFVLK